MKFYIIRGDTMELISCEECGRTFASRDGEKICKRCMDKRIDDDFKIVRDYLYEHPGADIKVVSRDTGVSEEIILKLLRQDRIEVLEDDNSILKCEKCGVPIKSGVLCEKCKKNEVARGLRQAARSLKEDLQREGKNETGKRGIVFHSKQDN